MTTIALISDQHICRSSRWEEGLRILDWIADEIARRKPDVVCLGGDLFNARPTSEEWSAAGRWLIRLADVAPVVGVYGNHDVALSQDVFPHLKARNPVMIYDRAEVVRVGDVAIACLPWPRKSVLLSALGRTVGREESEQAATGVLRDVLAGLGVELAAHDGPRVFLGHCMVRGSRVSSGQPVIGGDFEIGLEDIALARADAYLFGHIHMPQRFDIMGAPGVMPGSPRRTAFGEVEDKTFAWVTLDGHSATIEDVVTPATRMLLLEADWDSEHGVLIGSHRLVDVDGAELRFRYRVSPDQRTAARVRAEEYRTEALARGAIVVKLEERVDVQQHARVPEVASATTLAEKLEALWKARDVELDNERKGRLLGMAEGLELEVAA